MARERKSSYQWKGEHVNDRLARLEDKNDLSLKNLQKNSIIPNKLYSALHSASLDVKDCRIFSHFTKETLQSVKDVGPKGVKIIEALLEFYDLKLLSISELPNRGIDSIITNSCLGRYGNKLLVRDAVLLFNLTDWQTVEDIKNDSSRIPNKIEQIREVRFKSEKSEDRDSCVRVISFLEKFTES
jgi:hypothetical protein